MLHVPVAAVARCTAAVQHHTAEGKVGERGALADGGRLQAQLEMSWRLAFQQSDYGGLSVNRMLSSFSSTCSHSPSSSPGGAYLIGIIGVILPDHFNPSARQWLLMGI